MALWRLFGHALCLLAFSLMVLPTAPASAASCPSEALRSELHSGQLPDCRAYELVSPPYKEGAFISGVFAISTEGQGLIASSLGAFPGSEGEVLEGDGLGQGANQLGATYLFSRSPEGWTTAPLTPPSSVFRSNGLFDATPDLNRTLWELGRHRVLSPGAPTEEEQCEAGQQTQPEGVTDFYLEQPSGNPADPHQFTEIGPPTPDPCTVNATGYSYLGASAELTHVLFTVEESALRWPFDETMSGASTVYEYVGTQAQGEACEPGLTTAPVLVGVEGGHCSRALISRCGTRLGSSAVLGSQTAEAGNGSMYNAISTSGARIYFTAVGEDDNSCGASQPQADELFLREETSEGLPATTHTVPISCQQAAPCADANFEGASEDGSRVFFTSTQRLAEGASEDNTAGDSAVAVGSGNEAKGCVQTTGAGGCNLYEDELVGTGASLTQHLVAVSAGSTEPQVQGVARISMDGSHVYFVAKGVLTEANREGYSPQAGSENLYVSSAGHTAFIATLSPADNRLWRRMDDRPVHASRDGSLLAFTSKADLTHEDTTPGRDQVFLYDARAESLVRASVGEGGYNNNNNTPTQDDEIVNGPFSSYHYSRNDSPTEAVNVLVPQDGAVLFTSADALTPQALNAQVNSLGEPVPNVYEYRAGHVYLISDGHDTSTIDGNSGARLLGSDGSGEDVFLTTSDSLIGQDTDTQQDIYDARVEGGFPGSLEAQGCQGESCHGALGMTPALATPGSVSQSAEASFPLPPTPSVKAKAVRRKPAGKQHKRGKRHSAKRASARSRSARSRAHRKAGGR